MIKPLRKYHFQIWRAFALVLPIAFTMALVLRPTREKNSIKTNEFQFDFIKSSGNTAIKIKLTNPLQSPSCLVYALPKSGEKLLLGVIRSQGTYEFVCPQKITAIELFDGIHQKEIFTHYIDHEELP